MVGSLAIAINDNKEKRKVPQDRLNSLNDLALTLKHVHWNATKDAKKR
jgi:hypothetical protein